MADQNQNPKSVSREAVPSTPATPSNLEQQLAAALGALAESNVKMTALMEQQAAYNKEALKIAPRRKKTMTEYLDERRKRGAGKRLKRQVFQNGREVNPAGLSQETIDLLDTLAQGKYCEGMVDVVRVTDGVNGINSRIHLIYSRSNDMEKMRFYMRFPSFTKLVKDIADDMVAQGIKPVHEPVADPVEPEFPEAL